MALKSSFQSLLLEKLIHNNIWRCWIVEMGAWWGEASGQRAKPTHFECQGNPEAGACSCLRALLGVHGAGLAGLDLCSRSQRHCHPRRVEGGPRLGFSWKMGCLSQGAPGEDRSLQDSPAVVSVFLLPPTTTSEGQRWGRGWGGPAPSSPAPRSGILASAGEVGVL